MIPTRLIAKIIPTFVILPHTAQTSGVGGTTGVTLLEIREAP